MECSNGRKVHNPPLFLYDWVCEGWMGGFGVQTLNFIQGSDLECDLESTSGGDVTLKIS